jgi:hypothetical protein
MKKKIKSESILFNTEVKFTLNEKMDPAPSKLALRKLAEVNELISKSKYKSIEEMLKSISNDPSHK